MPLIAFRARVSGRATGPGFVKLGHPTSGARSRPAALSRFAANPVIARRYNSSEAQVCIFVPKQSSLANQNGTHRARSATRRGNRSPSRIFGFKPSLRRTKTSETTCGNGRRLRQTLWTPSATLNCRSRRNRGRGICSPSVRT
ncbi:hypothetical protein BDV10DRAFT_145268 [Aspergillus recurvatus]